MARRTITISIDHQVWEQIKLAAKQQNRSASNWLETVAIEALRKQGENSPAPAPGPYR